jgi:GT2 family glycosyltransferase
MKTLVVILQYNTHELTDSLYETLKPYEEDIYETIVVDNGSHKDKISKYTTHALDENVFYGGGVNVILDLFLESPQYDSVMILNNDIHLHGYNFVKTLREEMITGDFKVISPCVLEPHTGPQSIWTAMRPWHTNTTRTVPQVDYQAPMMTREFVEAVYPFPSKLIYGWGVDFVTGMLCEDKGWKIGVCDKTPIIHLVSQTLRLNPTELSNVNNLAERNMFEYFQETNNFERFINLRNKAFNYSI